MLHHTTYETLQERCRAWALRTARIPIASCLKDATLNLRMDASAAVTATVSSVEGKSHINTSAS